MKTNVECAKKGYRPTTSERCPRLHGEGSLAMRIRRSDKDNASAQPGRSGSPMP